MQALSAASLFARVLYEVKVSWDVIATNSGTTITSVVTLKEDVVIRGIYNRATWKK